MIESVPKEPLFHIAGFASIVGIVLIYLFRGFINEKHTRVKWFRRLLFPHLSTLIERAQDETDDERVDKLYVETEVSNEERVLDIQVDEDEMKYILGYIETTLKEIGFRPEVILASLASTDEGYYEVGNWVFTAPEKKHPDVPVLGDLYEIAVLLVAKWQLHVRIFYNEEEGKLEMYAHYEKNPYSYLHAKDHFLGEGLDMEKGRELFRSYLPEFEHILRDHEHEINHE